jgi:uncharacterized membrane protein YfcA
MLTHFIIGTIALIVSALTLFSGFGLGTILMPAFALFFPLTVAIAATAVVHLANNLFKLVLVGRHANGGLVVRFALPAALAAIAGAWLLGQLAGMPPLARYGFLGQAREIHAIKLVIGCLIVGFALLELSPRFADLSFPPRFLALGGVISGFFGGLSGNQGAFRSAFLLKAGLDKQAFVATGAVAAVIVDTVRLAVYGASFYTSSFTELGGDVAPAVGTAIIAAFVGSYVGARLLEKVTLRFIQVLVAVMMIGIGAGLASGLL